MRHALVIVAIAALVAAAAATAGTPPPGATALCRDGTYSYSKHRSGTCSHHGGVAKWLKGSGASGGSTSGIRTGRTVLLGHRTQTSGCTLGALPDRDCSPGAYYARLTKAVICSPSFRTDTIRNVPQAEKYAVEREYGMAPAYYGRSIEIDHIVSLELGGSNNIANLFPERHPGYHAKDRLENRLHDLVCEGPMRLRSVQRQIAANWQKLYRKVFGREP